MRFLGVVLGAVCSVAVLACNDSGDDQGLRMNEIQVLGTHNSYHIQPRDGILELLAGFESVELIESLEYTALPLRDQLDKGVRQLEFDIYADPAGGLYATRHILPLLGEDANSGLPELDEPGMKVLHIQEIDFETRCLTLQICLNQIKEWSDEHTGHLPITVMIGAKDDPIPDLLNLDFTVPVPFGPDEVDDIDEEIRAVFSSEKLITPDDVRGDYATLERSRARWQVADTHWRSWPHDVRTSRRGRCSRSLHQRPSVSRGSRHVHQLGRGRARGIVVQGGQRARRRGPNRGAGRGRIHGAHTCGRRYPAGA